MADEKFTQEQIINAKRHYKYGITHDIFKEPVVSYAKAVLWAFDEVERQKAEIEILIRKKESLRDEICELQLEVERLKEFEYAYNKLFK